MKPNPPNGVVFGKSLLRKLKRKESSEDELRMSLKRLDPPRILITPSPEETTPFNYNQQLLGAAKPEENLWLEPKRK